MGKATRAILIGGPPIIGSALLLMTTVDLTAATSTFSKNLKVFGFDAPPDVLLAKATDSWAMAIAIGIFVTWGIGMYLAHREVRTGREPHQEQMIEIAHQLDRALGYLNALATDADLPLAHIMCEDMIGQSDRWVEANMGPTALAKFQMGGPRQVYIWDGDHDLEIRVQRLELMNKVWWRKVRLEELHGSSAWDGNPPLGKRGKPTPVGPWKETLWLKQ